ncbi:MAG: hypothetical protein GY906_01245 [bacterium]|nr:hypothetical protein [bacterium]
MLRSTVLSLLGCCTMIVSVGCASSQPEPPSTVNLDYIEDGIDSAQLMYSSPVVENLVKDLIGSGVRCGGELDGELAVAISRLDNGSRSARYRLTDDDTTVLFRRRGSRWSVRVKPDDGGRLDIELPWAVAECLAGDGDGLEHLLRTGSNAHATVNIHTRSGKSHSFKVSLD